MPPSLPDDLSKWPKDPYRLLGLRPGASSADARKEYTRLALQYKPEQFPEQFRRIREAYESLTRFAAYPFFDPPPDADAAPPDDEPPASSSPEPSSELVFDPATVSPEHRPSLTPPDGAASDAPAQLWRRALAGEDAAAYHELRELANRPDAAVGACLRLYWLLRTLPDLDPARSPCDLLVQGLRNGGWHSVCQELYRREVEHEPAEAFSERFTALLETQAPLPMIADWLRWRWQAAGRLGKSQRMIADIDAMRSRFTIEFDDAIWPQLLLDAVDQHAWFHGRDAEQATARFCEELERDVHLHSRLDLHRLDMLRELSSSWKVLCQSEYVPRWLLELVPASWTRMSGELRGPVGAALRKLLQKPAESQELLDHIRLNAPLVLTQLASLVDRMSWESLDPEMHPQTATDLAVYAQRFVAEEVYSATEPPRQAFLAFCLDHAVLPHEALAAMPEFPAPALADQLRTDEGIRLLCVGQRWLWAGQ